MTTVTPYARTPASKRAGGLSGFRPQSQASGQSAASGEAAAGYYTGCPKIVTVFLLSLLVPFIIPIGEVALQPHRVVILATMPYLLARLASGQAGRITSIDVMIFLSALWCLIAYIIVQSPFARGALFSKLQFAFSFFFEMYGGFLIARVGIQSGQDLRRVTKFMFYTSLVCLPLAAVEAVTHRAFLSEILGTKPAYDVRFGMRRAQVVFHHPILYGTFVSSAMGLVWFTFQPQAKLVGRIFRSLIIFAALFFSFSMGAILSFVVQAGSIAYDHFLRALQIRWTLMIMAIVGMYVVIDIFANSSPMQVLVRYLTFNQQASYMRILIFEWGVENIMARPLFGFGSGDWTRPPGFPPSVDNFWLLIGMQFGIPAMLALIIGVILITRRLSLKALEDPMDIASRAAIMTSMGGIIIAGATVHYWQGMLSFVMFMFGSGIWLLSRPDPAPAVEAEDAAAAGPKPAAGRLSSARATLSQSRTPTAKPAPPPARNGASGRADSAQTPAKRRFVPYGRKG